MERGIKKIIQVPQNIFFVLSGPPRAYWGMFVLFVFIFLGAIFIFDVFLYFDAAYTIVPDDFFDASARLGTVNERALDTILSALPRNESALKDILQAPTVPDPSR
ncbi:MAG: hypothetical protein Q8O83_01430 [bacterium]|nr:hypothetical protein [bacterium]